MRNIRLTTPIVGAILTGGAAIALLLGVGTAFAASPTPTAPLATTSTASTTPSTQPAATAAATAGANNPFGRDETVSDASVVADAIGISVADLDAALAKGQTVAAIATAHGVAPQKVIDALVTDGLNELAAQVKAGTLTQAQADAQKAAVTQRATDQVNGTFTAGPGGAGCPGGPNGTGSTN